MQKKKSFRILKSILRKKWKQLQKGREDWEKEKTASFAKYFVTWGHRLYTSVIEAYAAPNLKACKTSCLGQMTQKESVGIAWKTSQNLFCFWAVKAWETNLSTALQMWDGRTFLLKAVQLNVPQWCGLWQNPLSTGSNLSAHQQMSGSKNYGTFTQWTSTQQRFFFKKEKRGT